MSLSFPNVLPECFVDTNLMQYFLKGTVNHQHCCSKVVGTMRDKFKDRFAIGIVDRDKVELGYIKECEEIVKSEHLTIFKHPKYPHYLITVAPAIDKFILDNAREEGVDTKSFGIPSELKGFTDLAKRVTSNKDTRFTNLFAAIKNAPEMRMFKDVLKYLLENNYNTDDLELVRMVNEYVN